VDAGTNHNDDERCNQQQCRVDNLFAMKRQRPHGDSAISLPSAVYKGSSV